MNQKSSWKPNWITVSRFANCEPRNVFHKEMEKEKEISEEEQAKCQNIHILCRVEFDLTSDIENATLRISADDHYKVAIDGNFLMEGPFPGYVWKYYYDKIENLSISKGKHVISVHLYYYGTVNRVCNSADFRCALAASLIDEQGNEIQLPFQAHICQAYSGGILGYQTAFLENFDNRLYPRGWDQVAYQKTDDFKWETMQTAKWADYELYEMPVEQLVHKEVTPATIEKRSDGSIFIDAGKEIVGFVNLKAKGKRGSQVHVYCGEELQDGDVRFDMRCGCRYEEVWTLDDGECSFDPYDYKAFRYVKLVADPQVEITKICLAERHYPMDEEKSCLKTTPQSLEQIFEICRRAVEIGTQEGYLDCPSREKGQYLGDSVITARSQVWLTGKTDMLLKCIDQFAQSARICPGLMAVAPGSLMQEIADYSLLYPELVKMYYDFTGDKSVLSAYLPTIEAMLAHFAKYEREDHLLYYVKDKWNMVDWPENLRDNYEFSLTRPIGPGCHNVVNVLYIGAWKVTEEIRTILGIQKEAYSTVLENAYRKVFLRENGLFADSENGTHCGLHANVYALYYGVAKKEEQAAIINLIRERGFSCGVMHSYFVLRALERVGAYKDVYELLVNETEHGWMNMIREGATTCFEAWGKDQKWNTSLCHPWASAPISVIAEVIGGIHLEPESEVGFTFEPHIPNEVQSFSMTLPFRGHKLTVCKKDGNIRLFNKLKSNYFLKAADRQSNLH